MTKVVCITSKVSLSLVKVDDPSHWQLCYKGFGRGLARANHERELQALRVLVTEHCQRGSTDSLPDRLLWLYCMHVNQPLAKFALSSLSWKHSETRGFELLSEVRRRNFIRLLLEKLSGDKLGRTIEFYLFVGSIANRALASEVKEEVLLAGQLFLSLENHRESTPWLPLSCIKAQKRRTYSVCQYGEKLFSRPLWVHFLYQILTGACTNSAKLAEAILAYLYSIDSSVISSYQYEGVSMVKQVLHFMETSKTSENHDSYTRVMKWRGAVVSTFLSNVRKDIRNEAEIILKGEFIEQIKDFLDSQLFCIDSQQVDLSGKPIEYTLVRARVHSLLFPMSAKHVEFYRYYRDEELGQKVVRFLKTHSDAIDSDFNREGFDHLWLDEVTIEMIEVFPFNIRRSLASIDTVCDRHFHHFLQDGLPLHSLDALRQVNWEKFKETASPQAVIEATHYIARISNLNPSMQMPFDQII